MVVLTFLFISVCDSRVSRDIPEETLNLYCWIHSTYTVPSAGVKQIGKEVPHPAMVNSASAPGVKHMKYYQWIAFMLFFQVSPNKAISIFTKI